jgi:hypothetical protein
VINRRTTKRGPLKGISQLRGVVEALRPASFAGVIETGFARTLSSRWNSMQRRLSAPVRRDFRKPKTASWTAQRPGRRVLTPANFSFFSSLQLTLALRPGVRALLAKAAASKVVANHVFHRFALPTGERRRERFFTERFLRESWSPFHPPGERIREVRTVAGREQVLSLVFGLGDLLLLPSASGPRPAATALRRRQRLGLQSQALVRLPGATERLTSFFSERLIASPQLPGGARAGTMPRSRTNVLHRFELGVSSMAMRLLWLPGGDRHAREIESAALLQSPPLLLRTPGDKPESPPSPGTSFTRIQLTLSAPRRDDREALAPRVSRFGPSPSLQYARQGALVARELAGSLRDLRQSLSDIAKVPAPAQPPQIDRLTRQVYEQLKRELQIEKERRGL